jgi:hypothetical protein
VVGCVVHHLYGAEDPERVLPTLAEREAQRRAVGVHAVTACRVIGQLPAAPARRAA